MINKLDLDFGSVNEQSNFSVSKDTIIEIIKSANELGLEIPVINPNLAKEDKENLIKIIAECIKEEGGDVSQKIRIVNLAMIYIHLSQKGKGRFLTILARNFDVDKNVVDENIKSYKAAKNKKDLINAELSLSNALIPPRNKLIKQFTTLPNGFIFLKDMRADLLPIIKSDLRLKKLSDDIKMYLTNFFYVNILDLKEITWNSPAILLERLMEYEAVHEITTWRALKHRLLTDHRVFGFFHNKMPNEPLIFVEVALVKGMSDNIQKLINIKVKPEDPRNADTAIFYSISSTQKGLEGINLGNFLLKRVVKKLSAEFPNIKQFATLSPVPNFRAWLSSYLKNGGNNFFAPGEKKQISILSQNKNESLGLLNILNSYKWFKNTEITDVLKKPLLRLCAHYLLNVKGQNSIYAYDPVANFHLSNGAKIEHIHWLADLSKRGIMNSAGIMLNYHYRLDKININHEAYMTNGSIHASSDALSWLT
jgi:malonyl-CoA decarboxylase